MKKIIPIFIAFSIPALALTSITCPASYSSTSLGNCNTDACYSESLYTNQSYQNLYDSISVPGAGKRLVYFDETGVDWRQINDNFNITSSLDIDRTAEKGFKRSILPIPLRMGWFDSNSGRKTAVFQTGDNNIKYVESSGGITFAGPKITALPTMKNSPMWRITYDLASHDYTNDILNSTIDHHIQCVFVYPKWCGDNDISNGEQCDDGNMTNGDGCSSTCTTETQTLSCTNLTIDSPANATLTGGGSVTLTCAGSGTISSYSIVVKKPDGTTLTTINTASGTATIPASPIGTYTATCFVNNQTVTTLPACEKSIQNNAPIPEPVCAYLEGVPSTLETNQSFTYTCHADRAKTGTQFTISGITPVKNETSNTGYYTDSHTFSTAGDYTVSCKVDNGAQVNDCQKTVTVSAPRVPNVTIDKRDANPNDSDGIVGNDTQTVSSGAKAVFKIKVTNNGTEDLKNISLSDTVAPNCAGNVTLGSTPNKPSTWSSFSTGGSGSHTDTLLQPGEWFEYTCEKDNTLGEYTNTARVDAKGNTSGIEVSDTDPTNILLEPLCTNLDVTPSTTTTNTLVAYNCTASGALSYQITRDGSYASSSASGTMNFTTAGQYELKCFINNKNTTPPSCVKKITVTNPPIITIPSIFIDKDDSTPGIPDTDGNDTQRVQNNGTATFTIRVQNNGNEALKTVVIDDPLASDCARTSTQTAVLYAGGTTTNFDVGETFSYLCTKTNVTSSTFTHNKNTASVKGVGVLSSINVTDSDVTEIYMKQNNPNITIDKNDDDNSDDTQEIDEDEIAQFTIKVTNNGDESLENVRIHDDLADKCEKNESETRALIRAIGNKDALFDPDEYFSYSCRESSISPDSFPDDINTACVAAIGVDSKKGVDECDDTEITVNKIQDEENLMCLSIESSKGSFGGAPFRTTITCEAVDYDSCEIEVMLDGEVIDTYDACSQSITLAEKGNYSVACIVNDERTPDCEMEIEVAAMTDIPTGAKICILAFLSLLLTALGTHLYKKRTS